MARPLRSALSPLVARPRARRSRAAVLLLLSAVLLGQTLLLVHRVDHNAVEHAAACTLCVVADQAADAVAATLHVALPAPPVPPAARIELPRAAPVVLAYRSRGPPPLARRV